MKFTMTCALSLAAAICTTAQAQAQALTKAAPAAMSTPLHPGLWEISIAEQAVNSPSRRTTVSRLCLAPEDVKLPERVIPAQRSFGMHCENLDAKVVDGATVTWKVVCKGKDGSSSGSATMTPAPDTYTAQVKLDSRLGGKAAKVEQTITGKRLGDCK